MTIEQIEKAAMGYAVENSWYPGETSYESDIKEMEESFADAFKAGSQWRISSVWHDAHEEPQHSGRLIASNKDGNYILCGPNNCNWKQTVKLFHIINWAYIIDLLPERKEESK